MKTKYRQALGKIYCCVHRVPEEQELKLFAITLSAGFNNEWPHCYSQFEVLTRRYPYKLLLSEWWSFSSLKASKLPENSQIFHSPHAHRHAIEYWYSLQVICGLKPLKNARNQAFLTPSCHGRSCSSFLSNFRQEIVKIHLRSRGNHLEIRCQTCLNARVSKVWLRATT